MTSIIRNSSIKHMEKEISKESKAEEGAVKQILKDLSRLEKDMRKAQKSARNADSTLSKREQYEHRTTKTMNNAIHEHDLAVAKLGAAEKDAKLKHKHHAKLMKELDAKKAMVENAMKAQVEHDQERETKLAQMRGVTVGGAGPLSPNLAKGHMDLPGQNGPAVENNGHAPGYGVDHNHTTVDSEGNPRDSRAQSKDGATRASFPGHFRL